MNDQLTAAEDQVRRCLAQFERAAAEELHVRGESLRLAVAYRNSLLTTLQLAEIEAARNFFWRGGKEKAPEHNRGL